MADKKNKVKFNICNVHYALQSKDVEGNLTFGTPIAIPGAVSLSLEPNGEPEPFYADGIEYYTANNNMGYEGELEVALLPETFRTDILNEEMDDNSVLLEDANVETSPFALLFEFDGDVKKIRHVMYNCSAARPTIESATNEDTKEPQTETLALNARPLPNGKVKAKTGDATVQDIYDGWYGSVYTPWVVRTEQQQATVQKATTSKATLTKESETK